MRLAILFFSFLLTAIVAHASTVEIPRTDGSMIRFHFEKPTAKSFPILIVLQGSTCLSVEPVVQMVSQEALSQGAGIIGVEKYGLSETTTSCPNEYLENNTVHQRIQDHLEVVAYLRAHVPEWNKSLGWAGGSEGGQVAALTAPLVPETKMLAMLASGGGLTMAEEMPIATERKLVRDGASATEIQKAKEDLIAHFQLIHANPTSNQEWLSDGKAARNTYKWWDSILWIKALPLLELVNFPIYVAHGTEDTSCPIESSDLLTQRLKALGKSNLTYRKYLGLEHNWSDLNGVSHTQEVLGDTFTWIFQNLH